jgi:transposase InsO family protein
VLKKHGITHQITMPYTPEQNGAAEQENRTIVESARSMLHASGLPKELWAEACITAVYILNQTGPTPVEGKTPLELWMDLLQLLVICVSLGQNVMCTSLKAEMGPEE